MSPSRRAPPTLLGWREWVALPDLGVRRIKAKLDTGARTSSLHAFHLKRFTLDGKPMARFDIHPVQRSTDATVRVEAEIVDERLVRNSGGHEELRPVVVTTLELGGERWPIELTLTRRDDMGFRMLLGRQALRRRAAVDPGRSYLAGKGEVGPNTRKPGTRRSGASPSKREEE